MTAMTVCSLAVKAQHYSYLTFETTSGLKTSVPVTTLSLAFSSQTLTVGNYAFSLPELSRMYFTTTDESSTPTGIQNLKIVELAEDADIYDLQGRKVTKDQMRKGVYVVKTKECTYKVNVE
jgi:hypothetical protein